LKSKTSVRTTANRESKDLEENVTGYEPCPALREYYDGNNREHDQKRVALEEMRRRFAPFRASPLAATVRQSSATGATIAASLDRPFSTYFGENPNAFADTLFRTDLPAGCIQPNHERRTQANSQSRQKIADTRPLLDII